MRILRFLCLALVILFPGRAAFSGGPITIGEKITVQSTVLREQRTVLVFLPPDYGRDRQGYPVLYLIDGDTHLTHTRGTVDFLAREGLMPQVIIVGITNTDRNRDLTPSRVQTRTTVPRCCAASTTV